MRKLTMTWAVGLVLAACAWAQPNMGYITDAMIRDDASISPSKIRGLVDLTQLMGGKTWYVNSTNTSGADAAGWGNKVGTPFLTLGYAITAASAGDLILVAPLHVEAVASNTGIIVDKALGIIGCADGELRPVFTFTTATSASIVVTGAGVRFENLIFKCGKTGDDHVTMLNITGAGCDVDNCSFRDGGSTMQTLNAITLGAGSDFTTIHNCYFRSTIAGAQNAITINSATTGFGIEGCYIYGSYSVSGIYSASAHTECRVRWNNITNVTAGAHTAIGFTAAATGTISFNIVNCTNSAVATHGGIDPGSCYCNENYGSDGVGDVSGVIQPAVDS